MAGTGTPVEAVFTGTDSLGYRNGQTYRLVIAATGGAVVIRRNTGGGMCPYGSWAAFGRNWRLLSPFGYRIPGSRS